MFIKKILAQISKFAAGKNKRIYLVGGLLRDLYMGYPGRDLDFAVSGDALSFARAVSDILKGTFIPLDRVNGVARVVFDNNGEKWQIDLSALKGWAIEEDLSRRDFTINAMALELSDYLKISGAYDSPEGERSERWRWHEVIIDPYGGLADIENKTIRATNDYVFEADPVRILRGVRLAGKLGFVIKPETLDLMKQSRWLLQEVAGERIWEELLEILDLPESYPWITVLDSIGAISEIFPFVEKMKVTDQNNHHKDNVWSHSLKTYGQLEEMCREDITGSINSDRGEELKDLLSSQLDSKLPAGRSRRYQLLKLLALFHDAGKIDTARVAEDGRITFPDHYTAGLVYVYEISNRLRISKAEESYLKKIMMHHMYPLYLFINQTDEPAAPRLFFNKLGKDVPDVLLLSLADVIATYKAGDREKDIAGYRAFAGDLLHKYYFEAETYVNLPPLVKGAELIEHLGLQPSKKVGSILKKIFEAQVRGEVNNREEALAYASRLLKSNAEES